MNKKKIRAKFSIVKTLLIIQILLIFKQSRKINI